MENSVSKIEEARARYLAAERTVEECDLGWWNFSTKREAKRVLKLIDSEEVGDEGWEMLRNTLRQQLVDKRKIEDFIAAQRNLRATREAYDEALASAPAARHSR